MSTREPALTDDMRAAVALRHTLAAERALGNAEAHAEIVSTRPDTFEGRQSIGWVLHWMRTWKEQEDAARAILPPADSWGATDWPAPAFVGGAS
jgi:hypothetical protein